ncbi:MULTISPECIES: alpha-1,2-fucosyltransferase [Prevotellaceae]|uniref:alpha-1,2-fucosyltransferase n=1 Tax=Prevotellaceae TaxID=171552 RepID=UPI0003D2EAC2|nr:alpha-1,2-fucosyltransferase [Prevotella phocaeensis]ETD21592.1 hypothetical protein HMPREF1199_00667 [Hoylesella oralis CC98A]
MDIVVIFNGLGNQMSQYAFYLAKRKSGSRCHCIFHNVSTGFHNGSELDKVFGIKYEKGIFSKLLSKIYDIFDGIPKLRKKLNSLGIHIIREPRNYDYTASLLPRVSRWGLNYFVGGWHSEKYYTEILQEIKNTFSFKIDDEIKDIDFYEFYSLIHNDINSVSLHIRRGDYVGANEYSYFQFGGVATLEYYHKAIDEIYQRIENPTFYVFSDDIGWCKTTFLKNNFIFVDCNCGEKSWRDMFLISQCKHHIIANSTFSWWGAWLSIFHNSITICPKEFIKGVVIRDVYPDTWIKLSS